MTHSVCPEDSTLVAEVEGIADQDGEYQDDATVTIEALTQRGSSADVTGLTLPLTLTYVPASDGVYRGLIVADADLQAGRWYRATIQAVLASVRCAAGKR